MKTKRRPAEVGNLPGFRKTVEESIKEEVAQAEPEPAPYRPGSRIQFSLKEDGSIDLDSMREATKEKLRAAIAASPGISANGSSPAVRVVLFPPQVIHAMYGTLGSIESMIAQRMGKIPKDIADRVFTYSPVELEMLAPPTERVLSKYAAEWMIKYQDELALAMLILSNTAAKVNAAITLSKLQSQTNGERKEPETAQNPGDGVNPKPN